MAHFAKIENGIVTEVIVISNETLGIRGVYAGIGYSWDGTNFVAPESDVAE